jgi:hypothetical protein
MTKLSNAIKTAAVAGLFGLGMMAATSTSALAHYSTTRCDRDGDTCWRVVCDDDGDDCRRGDSYRTGYDYNRSYWNRGYYRNGYYNGYDRDRYRRWVCDSDGDRCRWSYDRD